MNKPIYIGANILDESKLIMFKLYYDHLLPHFGEHIYALRDVLDVSCAPPSYYLPDVDKNEYMKNKGVIVLYEDEEW